MDREAAARAIEAFLRALGRDPALEPAVRGRRRLEDAAPLIGGFERTFPVVATRERPLDARTGRETAFERIVCDTLGIGAMLEGRRDLKIPESAFRNYEHFPT